MTFLSVRKHGNFIKFHKYFDITTRAKYYFPRFICMSTVEALRAETHHEPSRVDFLC